jgi:glycosyltransferase involved in cell wall biosynthesis
MKKLNILFLASWYPDKISPLSGNFIKKHAQSVAEFCNVYVIYVRALEQNEKWIMDEKSDDGLLELIVYYKKSPGKLPVISTLKTYILKMKAYKKAFNCLINKGITFDLVHLNVFVPAGVFARYLYKKFRIPFIVTEHWTKFLPSSKEAFGFAEKLVIQQINQQASAICPVSYNLRDEMIRFGIKNRFFVVPNVVNPDIFYPSFKMADEKMLRFLHISHLEEKHKNISGILNAFKTLRAYRNDFILTIVGDRNLEQTQEKAKHMNFPENTIRFEGTKTETEIAEIMRNHDIFVMFSQYENLPLMTGIPVISSAVGGVPEMINEKNGVLVNVGDDASFLKHLIDMMNNYKTYNKKTISEEAKKIYSSKEVGKTYCSIYERILNGTIC